MEAECDRRPKYRLACVIWICVLLPELVIAVAEAIIVLWSEGDAIVVYTLLVEMIDAIT